MASGGGLGRARRAGRPAPAQGPECAGGRSAADPGVGRRSGQQAHHRGGPRRSNSVPGWREHGTRHRRREHAPCRGGASAGRVRAVMTTRRYRLKLATWTVVRECGAPSPRTLSTPAAVAELAQDLLREHDDDKEHFWAILLNAQNHYLLHTEVSVGTQSASLVHPREVLGPALREGASSVILIHNHPSGDPTPSREDLRLTRQLRDAAALLDLNLHDHIIIGNGTASWASMAERGLI